MEAAAIASAAYEAAAFESPQVEEAPPLFLDRSRRGAGVLAGPSVSVGVDMIDILSGPVGSTSTGELSWG